MFTKVIMGQFVILLFGSVLAQASLLTDLLRLDTTTPSDIQALLKGSPDLVNVPDFNGVLPLVLALEKKLTVKSKRDIRMH